MAELSCMALRITRTLHPSLDPSLGLGAKGQHNVTLNLCP